MSYTIDEVLSAARPAHCQADGTRFYFDGRLFYDSSMFVGGVVVMSSSAVPQDGWRHDAGCDCALCGTP